MLRRVVIVYLLFLFIFASQSYAQIVLPSPQTALPSPQSNFSVRECPLPVPQNLPEYAIHARLDLKQLKVIASQSVKYTNRTTAAQPTVVFHVYPKFKVKP